ncbi:MAG: dihydrodipicolinate synthase family protein [Rhodospirillales bacterium]|nr:dihydrodipicolinate synthase family protein [Rhodospirillales bacterium]
MTTDHLQGIYAAVMTPMQDDLSCDMNRLAAHCRSLLDEGCHGVSLFGTTGEGPALTTDERQAGLEAVLTSGVAPHRVLPGTGCAAIPDAVRLTRHATGLGCKTVLVMPPFFFKDIGDDGVVAFYAALIEGVGDPALRVIIYNFPAVTGVWVRERAIERLIAAYPHAIAGVKDSSGDWPYVAALLRQFPSLAVFSGWETWVPKLVAAGGAGNISGMANVIPGLLRQLYDNRSSAATLSRVSRLVEEVSKYPIIPALKVLAATLREQPSWRNMRAPLVALPAESERSLVMAFERILNEKDADITTGT